MFTLAFAGDEYGILCYCRQFCEGLKLSEGRDGQRWDTGQNRPIFVLTKPLFYVILLYLELEVTGSPHSPDGPYNGLPIRHLAAKPDCCHTDHSLTLDRIPYEQC